MIIVQWKTAIKYETFRHVVELEQEVKTLRARAMESEAARQWLQALIETFPSGMLFANVQGEITLANPAASELLGGQIPSSVYHTNERAAAYHPDGTPFAMITPSFARCSMEKPATMC